MDDATTPEWAELYRLMQEHYPDLPAHEGHANILHDAFIKFPMEMTEIIKPALPHLADELPKITDMASFLLDLPTVAVYAKVVDLAKSVLKKVVPHRNQNLTTNPNNGCGGTFDAVPYSPETLSSADYVVKSVHGIHVMGKSLVDRIDYYGRWMQTFSAIRMAQGYWANQTRVSISDHLGEGNIIRVSGSGGPDGFGRHVYDFIKERIDEIDKDDKENHRFFVYHPDTNWYGAFNRLARYKYLPSTFCAKSDDLDTVCRYMQDVRTQLNSEPKDEKKSEKEIVFHLLIPSWYQFSFKEPLHFPDNLQPFLAEGEKHKGKPLVEFNLPAAPAGLLHGIANPLDPKSVNKIAQGISNATLAFSLGLGAMTGLGALVTIPVWFGTAMPAMGMAAPIIGKAVYGALYEEAPRVLGSDQRLNMAGRRL